MMATGRRGTQEIGVFVMISSEPRKCTLERRGLGRDQVSEKAEDDSTVTCVHE